MYNPGVFIMFMMLCDHCLYLVPKPFNTPKGDPVPMTQSPPLFLASLSTLKPLICFPSLYGGICFGSFI